MQSTYYSGASATIALQPQVSAVIVLSTQQYSIFSRRLDHMLVDYHHLHTCLRQLLQQDASLVRCATLWVTLLLFDCYLWYILRSIHLMQDGAVHGSRWTRKMHESQCRTQIVSFRLSITLHVVLYTLNKNCIKPSSAPKSSAMVGHTCSICRPMAICHWEIPGWVFQARRLAQLSCSVCPPKQL